MFIQAKCRQLPGAAADLTLPLVIMTSEDTDAKTRELVEKEGRYGMAKGQIIIVMQDKVKKAARFFLARAVFRKVRVFHSLTACTLFLSYFCDDGMCCIVRAEGRRKVNHVAAGRCSACALPFLLLGRTRERPAHFCPRKSAHCNGISNSTTISGRGMSF